MLSKAKDLICRAKSSKDGKAIVSNFGFLMLLQVSSYMFPLITIPYLARVIGVDGFGKIAFAAAVTIWFQTISDWGFNYTATRDVARNRNDLEKISIIFSNVLWARVFLMFVSLVILVLLVVCIPYFSDNKIILFMAFLMVPGNILYPAWFFQAIEEMKYITIFNLLSKVLFTVLVFIVIKDKEDYVLQPLLTSLGFILSGFGAMYLIVWRWGFRVKAPDFPEIIKIIGSGSDVFINNISRNLYNSFSVIILGFFSGSTANGILDAGRKFVDIAQNFMTIFDRVFFPFLSRKIDYHESFAKGVMLISTLGTIVLFISAPLIVSIFYTEEFSSSIPVLQVMSLSLISVALNAVYGTSYLVLVGKERLMRNITIIVSIIGFISAFPLIKYFSYMGAAINIVSAQTILGVSMMIFSKKHTSSLLGK